MAELATLRRKVLGFVNISLIAKGSHFSESYCLSDIYASEYGILDQGACMSYNTCKVAADASIALGKHPGTSSTASWSHYLHVRHGQGTAGNGLSKEMALDILE